MQFTCAALLTSLNTRDHVPGKTHRCCQIYEPISTGCSLLNASFTASIKSSLCTSLTIQNTTESICFISHAQNTTALQPIFFLLEYTGHCSTAKDSRLSPPRKQLPRSSSDSTVTVCRWLFTFLLTL